MNLADALAATARRDPDGTAVVYRDRTITYRELDAEADRVASSLIHLGVDAGDRVALWLPNHPAFVTAMYGAWRVGAIVVPVHTMLTERETRHILQDSGARVLFCAEPRYSESAGRLRDEMEHLETVVVLGGGPRTPDLSYDGLLEAGAGTFPPVELPDDHLALIAYTSGTSGLPKGAMLSHRSLRANIDQMLETPLATTADDVVLCVLPVFHIFGLNVVCNLSLAVGATIVLMERFDAAAALRTIKDRSVTVMASAPPSFAAWLRDGSATPDDFASIRVAVSGAAPLPAEVLTDFSDRFGVTIWEGYGMTETSPALTSTSVGGTPKPGSIGRPIPGVELRLVAEDGDDVEEGDPGEVYVRGPNVFAGYWQQPEETSRVLRDGWFRTGDVAIADDEGDLYIVDRKRDLILVSGFNVYPKEIEDVLLSHAKIRDCAVVGEPDENTGEHVKAIVVAEPGTDPSEEEIVAWCRLHLAPFKVPSSIDFEQEIPRNAAGKVLRRELRPR